MADKDPLAGLGKDLKILLNPKIGIIFSLLFSIHSLWYGQGEFVQQSQASLMVDHFPYSHGLYVWFNSDTEGRNTMPITFRC